MFGRFLCVPGEAQMAVPRRAGGGCWDTSKDSKDGAFIRKKMNSLSWLSTLPDGWTLWLALWSWLWRMLVFRPNYMQTCADLWVAITQAMALNILGQTKPAKVEDLLETSDLDLQPRCESPKESCFHACGACKLLPKDQSTLIGAAWPEAADAQELCRECWPGLLEMEPTLLWREHSQSLQVAWWHLRKNQRPHIQPDSPNMHNISKRWIDVGMGDLWDRYDDQLGK